MSNPNGIGKDNACLQHGRISYGMSGTTAVAIKVDADGGLGLTKTIQTDLISAQTIAASTNVISAATSITGVKKAAIHIFHGRASTAAFTTNGTEYRVEVSAQSSGNEAWQPLVSVLCSSTVCSSAAASSNCAAGTTLVTITSGTAMSANDIICFTSGTIEWVRSTVATGTASFNVLDATTYSHASATGMFGSGEFFPLTLNLEAAVRLRAVVNNIASAGTLPIASRVALITEQ